MDPAGRRTAVCHSQAYRRLSVAAVGMVAATLCIAAACGQDEPAQQGEIGPVPTLTKEELERVKLAAEISSVRAATARESSPSAAMLEWAPFLTALVAIGGIGLSLRTQRRDRLVERRKRHDEELARIVQNLGSQTAAVRLNAAAALTSFLGPESPEFHTDLLTVIIANLKIEPDRSVADVLVRDLELAIRQCLSGRARPKELDLARAGWLVRLDLRDLDFGAMPVDIAFANLTRADLSGVVARRTLRGREVVLNSARLTSANLHEARLDGAVGVGATFHRARLVSATFRDADLSRAQFHHADLRGAHFEGAVLAGATFVEADVTDAWFCDARNGRAAALDDGALRTLARTRHRSWRRAHLVPAHRYAIAAYAGELDAIPPFAARLVRSGSLDEATRWYGKALAAGVAISPGALRKLGQALHARGGSGDAAEAVRWLELAARRGDPQAVEALRDLTRTTGGAPQPR